MKFKRPLKLKMPSNNDLRGQVGGLLENVLKINFINASDIDRGE